MLSFEVQWSPWMKQCRPLPSKWCHFLLHMCLIALSVAFQQVKWDWLYSGVVCWLPWKWNNLRLVQTVDTRCSVLGTRLARVQLKLLCSKQLKVRLSSFMSPNCLLEGGLYTVLHRQQPFAVTLPRVSSYIRGHAHWRWASVVPRPHLAHLRRWY